ncbi:class I SAM-dependent methyltransferase [Allopusillimonas ginsengisoli]|uniref:class I SAM-dependent methyltransferase n=1 Tax=Allopusillimonas ginsengisoli TaxID=453575 RepID=UPI00102096EB|nr:methyltransferase domain-containing protein [Allopusillimonas ginsengisoli]TEA79028.1 class I SAM-dependent methyltransferase [Allopusillimonas ginsengisoli]
MSADQPIILDLAEWLETPPGRYVRGWEQKQVDTIVSNVFGYHAIQVGLPHWDLLQANRIPYKGRTHIEYPQAAELGATMVIEPESLPFESQSIDLLVLPHVLECSSDPHQVLREAERVLMPEGRVVITGFNPWSLWGLSDRTPGLDPLLPVPAHLQVSLPRIKDWFKLLSFELDRGRFGCYRPACNDQVWLDRWAFMDKAGDRWWPVCGAVYVVSAIKRVAGMRLVGPNWKKAKKRMRRQAVVTGRQHVARERQEKWQ